MFQIGDFSKITQVSVRMLRYYDQNDLLHPAYIDKFSGYRLYQADQIETLHQIVKYRDMGFSVKEIKALLATDSQEELRNLLKLQLEKTKETILSEQRRLSDINSFLKDMDQETTPVSIQITLRSLPATRILSLRRRLETYYHEGELWEDFSHCFKAVNNYPAFTLYHDTDYREKDVDVEVCIEIMEDISIPQAAPSDGVLEIRELAKVPLAASFIVYGPYSNISGAYREFAYWLEAHEEYQLLTPSRQLCYVGCDKTDKEEEFVTEIIVPLAIKSNNG